MSHPHQARPRLSSTVTEPFDPVYGYNDLYDNTDNDVHQRVRTTPAPGTVSASASAAAAPETCLFSPYEALATSGMPPVGVYGGGFFESPEHSPRLQPTAMPVVGRATTADSTVEVPSMSTWIAPLPPSVARMPTRERDFAAPPLRQQSTFAGNSNSSSHPHNGYGDVEVPLSPAKPAVGIEVEERAERSPDKKKRESLVFGEPGSGRRASVRMARHESMATRLGRSIIGTVKRSRTTAGGGLDRWTSVRRSRLLGDEDYTELGVLDEREAPIGIDVSTFGPEFSVPHQTAKAMETAGFNENLAYTGA